MQRLIEKDWQASLDSEEAAKEEKKIQKIIDKHKNESEDERAKRKEKEEKEREDDRKFTHEVGDAYNFRHGQWHRIFSRSGCVGHRRGTAPRL